MKIGDIVKLVRNTTNAPYVVGKKYIIHTAYNNGQLHNGNMYWYLTDPENNIPNNGSVVVESDLTLWSLTKKDVEKRVNELEIEFIKNQKILEYMKAENKEEVDPVEFFAWYIINIMESQDPKKTEKLSKLLNSVANNINIDKIVTR